MNSGQESTESQHPSYSQNRFPIGIGSLALAVVLIAIAFIIYQCSLYYYLGPPGH